MKKIAIIIPELARPGGAEKVAFDLMQEFNRRNYAVTVIRFDKLDSGETAYEVQGEDKHLNIPNRQGGVWVQMHLLLLRAWCFWRIFHKEKFDHIFSFLEAANIPCAIASSKSVLSVHLDPNTMTRKIWLAMTLLYPRAKRVVAVSQQMRVSLEQRAKLNNVKCIYNPIDIQLIQQKATMPIMSITRKFILGVGRLESQKRFDRLITAYANTSLKQECDLILVGSGSQANYLRKQIQELGLDDKILLIGFDDNPYKYMAKAQFQVMSSDYEGYPLVLIEALSLGCPIISTDCPTGPREIIQPYLNGLLVELTSEALTQAMDQLYYDKVLLNQLRNNALASVSANHIQLIADEWLAA